MKNIIFFLIIIIPFNIIFIYFSFINTNYWLSQKMSEEEIFIVLIPGW
jgi:hypothetical protein